MHKFQDPRGETFEFSTVKGRKANVSMYPGWVRNTALTSRRLRRLSKTVPLLGPRIHIVSQQCTERCQRLSLKSGGLSHRRRGACSCCPHIHIYRRRCSCGAGRGQVFDDRPPSRDSGTKDDGAALAHVGAGRGNVRLAYKEREMRDRERASEREREEREERERERERERASERASETEERGERESERESTRAR